MLRFKQTHPAGGDCTAPYDVTLDHDYTFDELVNEILLRNEWGYINFGGYRFEYRYNKCDNIPENLLTIPVKKVTASGGWSRMDYYII